MSFTVIAEKLGVSIGTIRTRFNKLIEDGTINIIGRVDPDKVGFRSYAHIAVFVRPATLKEKVAQEIMKMPEVSFLHGYCLSKYATFRIKTSPKF